MEPSHKRLVPTVQPSFFDASAFYSALSNMVALRNIDWKTVSEQTGVSRTTLSRMKLGRKPDAASLAMLSAWAGINPANYVRPVSVSSQAFVPPNRKVKAARMLIDWTQKDLAAKAGVAVSTVADFESGTREPIPATLEAMTRALESHGILFHINGCSLDPDARHSG